MAYLIGTDEAGYGPNLGPLVIAVSVWQVADQQADVDLYNALESKIVNHATLNPRQLAIADSKRLYRPGHDLTQLERGILTLLATQRLTPNNWQRLRHEVGAANANRYGLAPWSTDADFALPTSSAATFDATTVSYWEQTLRAANVRLIHLRAVEIDVDEFNSGVTRYDSKGALLSHRTLDLIGDVIRDLADEPIDIVCDRHGGRRHYAPLLQPRFPGQLVRVIAEGRAYSAYAVGTRQRPVRISFQVGGESFLPSALASMLAKYLRELHMRAFNAFWQSHLPDLHPTAGYPVDARRFREQIRPLQRRLGIADQLLWRCR